jgi:beta-glucanase (GH16 family)
MTNSTKRSFSRWNGLRITSSVIAAGGALAGCFSSARSPDASVASDASETADAGNDGPGTSRSDAEGTASDGAGVLDAAEIALDASAGDAGGSFVLSWQDNFDTLDLSSWQLQTFTYTGNEAQFSTQNAAVANGILSINLTPNPSDTAEPYLGVEMRSAKTLAYGRLSASMRFATGSGVVSGLVLFYTPYPNCNWNEIDIEHLGDSSGTSQLNCQVYTGTVMPQCTTSVTPTQDPLIVNLGVNAETAFHQYDIEWTPAGVTTFVDGTPLRTWTTYSSLMNLPPTVLLTIWASSAASWAGALQADSAPTSAEVDWIKVYDWQP